MSSAKQRKALLITYSTQRLEKYNDPVHPPLVAFWTHQPTLYGRCATGLLYGDRLIIPKFHFIRQL